MEDDLPVALVQARRIEGLGRLTFLLLKVMCEEAGLVADVVGGGQFEIDAQLSLVRRKNVVAGKFADYVRLQGQKERKC